MKKKNNFEEVKPSPAPDYISFTEEDMEEEANMLGLMLVLPNSFELMLDIDKPYTE